MKRYLMQLYLILNPIKPNKKRGPTKDLVYESEHVPLSVSLADMLNRQPEDIILSKDSKELVRTFWAYFSL